MIRDEEWQRNKAIRDAKSFRSDWVSKARKEGREEGIQEGMEKGKLLVALNMLKNGLKIPLISKLTKLSEKEIKKLKKE